MADAISLAVGMPPWRPAPDARVAREYNYWNMPTLGVVMVHGVPYLFECMVGQEGNLHLWRYVLLRGEEDLARLDAAGENVYAVVDEMFEGQTYTLALAMDTEGVFLARHIEEPWHPDTAGEIVNRVLDEFLEEMEEASQASARMREGMNPPAAAVG